MFVSGSAVSWDGKDSSGGQLLFIPLSLLVTVLSLLATVRRPGGTGTTRELTRSISGELICQEVLQFPSFTP